MLEFKWAAKNWNVKLLLDIEKFKLVFWAKLLDKLLKKGLIVIILAYKAEVLEERRKLNSKFYIMRIGYKIHPQ